MSSPDNSIHAALAVRRAPLAVLVAVALLLEGRTSVPAAEPIAGGTAASRPLWSLQPIRSVPVPTVPGAFEGRTPIDAFVAAELHARGLSLRRPAARSTLLRRASLDLLGLPPEPADVDAFERDEAPGAFDRAIERLLGSPRYGERWARHWLDLARYAESEGFKADETRPNAWRYRDYVITAFNEDRPYDRFIREQLAGDELWPEDPVARIATGFNRHYPDESNARNLMQRRQEILNDITDTVGSVFLGLTIACARCHDHKFDPITQADYYRLQAFFANTGADDRILLVPGPEVERYREALSRWEDLTRDIRDEMECIESPARQAILDDYVEKYPENIQVALRKGPSERSSFERQMVAKARLYLDPESHQYIAGPSACMGRLKKEEKARWQELKQQLDRFTSVHPGRLPTATGISDVAGEPPPTHVLSRGNWNSPREEVQPGFPSVLHLPPPEIMPSQGRLRSLPDSQVSDDFAKAARPSSGRRSALAQWLTAPSNPLTARVMVNRIWQHHFGRGLVGTPGDFGFKGEEPTHAALLDWLATEFVHSGWSVKHMHRLILRSAVYQQDSAAGAASAAGGAAARDPSRVDPGNRWYWHFPRERLEGETIRDASLQVAGRLNPAMGGQSVFPELPAGMESRGGWKVSEDPAARDRRSVYVFVRRNTRYPMFEAFDMPDTHETCPRRNVTTSPVQALTLLNSRVAHEWGQSFAGRVLSVAGADPARQVEEAWRLAFSRRPQAEEVRMAREFLDEQRALIAGRRARGEPVARPTGSESLEDPDRAAALVDLCHALLNSNEFVYRD